MLAGQSVMLNSYLAHFAALFGDSRTRTTFQAIMMGILTGGSLVCARIAAQAPLLCAIRHGSQRVLRFATGESTHRSSVPGTSTATRLVEKLAQRGASSLGETPTGTEVWLVLDGSELRKPYAKEMPDLMRVRDLSGELVPGYRTLNVLAVTPQHRALMYHRLFSSKEENHISESHEIQLALGRVGATLAPIRAQHPVTWIMDSGFDDIAVWRTVWEQEEYVLCRVHHLERSIEYKSIVGSWQHGQLQEARIHLRERGTVETTMAVRLHGQKQEKRQPVTVELSSCPVRLTYQSNVRRIGEGQELTKHAWVVRVIVRDSYMEPWYLMTDWPCNTPKQVARIFQMYRQRWCVEEAFQFLKMCVGWEDVQVLDLEGVRTLVALGWVAAGFLYEIDSGWEWVDVELLAKLGGFEPHKGRKPGKKTLLWGLQRVLDYMVTQAMLRQHKATTGFIPPGVAALLGKDALDQL